MLKMKSFVISAVLAASPFAQAQDHYCPTPERIKTLTQEMNKSGSLISQEEAELYIKDAMYRLMVPGYSAERVSKSPAQKGNSSYFNYNRSAIFVDENDKGNREILKMAAQLNANLFEEFKKRDEHIIGNFDPKHATNGMFKINYTFDGSASECRRQIIIGKQIETEDGELNADSIEVENGMPTGYFTGVTSVEICDPELMGLFQKGTKTFSKQVGESADQVLKSVADAMATGQEVSAELLKAASAAKIYKAAEAKGFELPGMKSFDHFLFFVNAVIQGLKDQGKISKASALQTTAIRLNSALGMKNQRAEVVMFNKDANGNILPRFGAKLEKLYYRENPNSNGQCELTVFHDTRAAQYAGLVTNSRFDYKRPNTARGDYGFIMQVDTDSIEPSEQILWYWEASLDAEGNVQKTERDYNYAEILKKSKK